MSIQVIHCKDVIPPFRLRRINTNFICGEQRVYAQVYINKMFEHKIVNIFLTISVLTYVLGIQMKRLIETLLLCTNNIRFG